jgi:hypothetical protein
MSTATPSEVGTTVSWADIASEPDIDDLRQADLIPRSVQPDRDVATPYQQDSNRKHHRHHRAFQPSSAFDTAGYDNLNINIPLSPYTSDSLSMRFTNEHGKVQEIIARFESCADCKHPIETSLTHHAKTMKMSIIVLPAHPLPLSVKVISIPKWFEPSFLPTIASGNRVRVLFRTASLYSHPRQSFHPRTAPLRLLETTLEMLRPSKVR